MSVDVSQVAAHARLQVLADPTSRQLTGAYLVLPNGLRASGSDDAPARCSELAVLDWTTPPSGGVAQPLDLVLARLVHRYRPSTVAVMVGEGVRPPRAVLVAAAEARVGVLWGTDSPPSAVIEQVFGLLSATPVDHDVPEESLPSGVPGLAELLEGDPGLVPLTGRLAAALDAVVTVRGADGQLVLDTSAESIAEGAATETGDEHTVDLRLSGAVIGRLGVRGRRDVTDDARRTIGSLGGVVALALQVHITGRTQAGPAQTQLALMLGDDLQAREAAFRRSRRLRLFPSRRSVVAVVEPFAPPMSRTGLARLADQLDGPLRAADPRATMIVFEGGLVLLTDADTNIDALGRGFRRVASMPLSVGVGRAVADLRSLPGAHREAWRAATIGRRLGAANQVRTYDQLGVLRLLYQLPEHERRGYVDEVLGPLAGSGPDAVEHRRVLRALRESHCNLAEAARLLFVHRNTVRQRVDRLEAVLGPILDDADQRLAVFVALELHRLDNDQT